MSCTQKAASSMQSTSCSTLSTSSLQSTSSMQQSEVPDLNANKLLRCYLMLGKALLYFDRRIYRTVFETKGQIATPNYGVRGYSRDYSVVVQKICNYLAMSFNAQV